MRNISRYTIPIVAAGLVFTARTEDDVKVEVDKGTDVQVEKREGQLESVGAPGATERQSRTSQEQERSRQVSQQQRNQQSTFRPGEVTDSQLKRSVTEVNKASSFIGMAVKNLQDEDVGKVHDLVFDPTSGKISYAVLSIGGVLGIGDKLIAVPVTSLKPQPGQQYLVSNMNKSQVQAAPGLAQNNWPDLDAQGLGGSAEFETSESASSGAPAGTSSSSSRSTQSPTTTPSTTPSTTTPNTLSPEPTRPSDQQPDQSENKSSTDSQGASATSQSGTSTSSASPGSTSTTSSPGSASNASGVGSNSDSSQSTAIDPEKDSKSQDQ